ncbi:MAG: PQQ-binding-like beta-propeller repeat protein [Candidatus Aureabacteria bacterium]|nr:PQQ-binding-like beta-propeller repeat protein [Candidatus Auribacterota bacterium]
MKKVSHWLFLMIPLCICMPAYAQPDPASPWPMFQHDTRHTGRSQYTGPSGPVLCWSYMTGNSINSSPSLSSQGCVYIGSSDKKLYALNSDGSVRWVFLTGGWIYSCPAISIAGDVYFGSEDNRLYAVKSNGVLGWSYSTGPAITSSPPASPALSGDGSLYIGSWDRNLYSFNSNGSCMWSYETGKGIGASSPALENDGNVYVGSSDNRIYALASVGWLRWSYATGDEVNSSPALGDYGSVYIGSGDNRIYAISSDSHLEWSYDAGNWTQASPSLGSDGSVYIGFSNHILYALCSTGSLHWSYGTKASIDDPVTLGSDGRVYLASSDNNLQALESSGSMKWSYNFDAYSGLSSAAMGSDERIYIGSHNHRIYCFAQPTATLTPTVTPSPTATPTFVPTPPVGAYAYVTNTGSYTIPGTTVSRIDLATYTVSPIIVGVMPMGIDITPDGEWVYVVNNDSDSVSVIHTGDAREIMQIPVGVEPIGIAIDHGGKYAYVTNSTDTPQSTEGTVSVIDLTVRSVIDTIAVGRFPAWGIDVSNDDSKIAVANFNDDTVFLIDTMTRQRIGVVKRDNGFAPMDVKFGPGDERLYIAYYSDGTHDHVRSVDLVGSSPDLYYDQEGDGPTSVSFQPGGNWFVASNYIGNDLYHFNVVSGTTAISNVAAGPLRGAFATDGNRFFVPCFRSSQDIHVGVVEIVDYSSGVPVAAGEVSAGINPSAIVIANRALIHSGSGNNAAGINLYAEPKMIKKSDNVYLKYAVVLPAGMADIEAGVIVGGVMNDAHYYAFTSGFKGMVEINPNKISSIPKTVQKMRLTNGMSGYLGVRGLPSGTNCRLFVALTDVKSGKLIYHNLSNGIWVE